MFGESSSRWSWESFNGYWLLIHFYLYRPLYLNRSLVVDCIICNVRESCSEGHKLLLVSIVIEGIVLQPFEGKSNRFIRVLARFSWNEPCFFTLSFIRWLTSEKWMGVCTKHCDIRITIIYLRLTNLPSGLSFFTLSARYMFTSGAWPFMARVNDNVIPVGCETFDGLLVSRRNFDCFISWR